MQIRSSHADTKGRMILLGFMYGPKALINPAIYGTVENHLTKALGHDNKGSAGGAVCT